ncbi:MAG: methylated-DNA--[protein]-cysteine S-methyltransferase [Candidatus Anstonellaceae archaeon]
MKLTAAQRAKLSSLTPFQRSVLLACAKIPKGQTRTYAQLARAIGKPKAARAVANALAANPFAFGREQPSPRSRARKNPPAPMIPCHRVIRSDGSLGGYSGQGGMKTKARLLHTERKTNI